MTDFFSIAPLSIHGVICAMLAGSIIGFERQRQGKPVGIRTGTLICLGTYVFVCISNSITNESTDATRVIGQVITGIGFLGAGVIMSKDGLVIGVTSAAAIWMLAAIGVTIALHHYVTGIKLAILVVLILVGVDALENIFKVLQRGIYKKLHLKQ